MGYVEKACTCHEIFHSYELSERYYNRRNRRNKYDKRGYTENVNQHKADIVQSIVFVKPAVNFEAKIYLEV